MDIFKQRSIATVSGPFLPGRTITALTASVMVLLLSACGSGSDDSSMSGGSVMPETEDTPAVETQGMEAGEMDPDVGESGVEGAGIEGSGTEGSGTEGSGAEGSGVEGPGSAGSGDEASAAGEMDVSESSGNGGSDPTGSADNSFEQEIVDGGEAGVDMTPAPPADTGTDTDAETDTDTDTDTDTGETDQAQDTFSDDFNVDSLSNWSLRSQVENTAAQFTTLDINSTTSGALTIIPTLTPGWFANEDAPLIFKLIAGDFSVETEVTAQSTSTPGMPPSENFNSAGLMARDPAGADGPENYIMVNVGRQNNSIAAGIGSETKSTRNSESQLALQAGTNEGRLILCRSGDSFSTYRLLNNETQWTRIGRVSRPDLPAELQVGMIANGFNGPDIRATFNYITLRRPADADDCLPQ